MSVAVAVPIDALDVHNPASAVIFAVAGHVITGFCVSVTFTVCEQVAVFPLASVAVQVIVCVPTAYGPKGRCDTVAPLQLSVEVAVPMDALDVQSPKSAAMFAVAGQVITGF